jgi:hypothetical protein
VAVAAVAMGQQEELAEVEDLAQVERQTLVEVVGIAEEMEGRELWQ